MTAVVSADNDFNDAVNKSIPDIVQTSNHYYQGCRGQQMFSYLYISARFLQSTRDKCLQTFDSLQDLNVTN